VILAPATGYSLLLHAAADGDSALFLLVVLGIVVATIVAVIRGRRSR
jgi:hypothetical protein